MSKPFSKWYLVLWVTSWFKLVWLNYPYVKARCEGYKYYLKVGVHLVPTRKPKEGLVNAGEVRHNMKELGAEVYIVRVAKRMNARSFGYKHFAVFKTEEDAILYKLAEGGGKVRKFTGLWK